jgi:hypothetical protein
MTEYQAAFFDPNGDRGFPCRLMTVAKDPDRLRSDKLAAELGSDTSIFGDRGAMGSTGVSRRTAFFPDECHEKRSCTENRLRGQNRRPLQRMDTRGSGWLYPPLGDEQILFPADP